MTSGVQLAAAGVNFGRLPMPPRSWFGHFCPWACWWAWSATPTAGGSPHRLLLRLGPRRKSQPAAVPGPVRPTDARAPTRAVLTATTTSCGSRRTAAFGAVLRVPWAGGFLVAHLLACSHKGRGALLGALAPPVKRRGRRAVALRPRWWPASTTGAWTVTTPRATTFGSLAEMGNPRKLNGLPKMPGGPLRAVGPTGLRAPCHPGRRTSTSGRGTFLPGRVAGWIGT